MKHLIRASLSQGVLLNIVFVGLIIMAAVVAVPSIPVDRFPNINFGEAEITTLYPGAAPEEVEVLVTQEIEDALRDMNDLEFIRGSSRYGRSTVRVKFIDDSDYNRLYDELRLRILAVQNRLPQVNNQPLQPVFNLLDVDEWLPLIQVNLVPKDDGSQLDRRALILLGKELRNHLERLDGVKRVELMGERQEQLELVLDPDALTRHRVDLESITTALAAGGTTLPAGTVESDLGERVVRIDGRYRQREDLGAMIIRHDGDGSPLRLRDLLDHQASGITALPGGIIQSINGRESVGAKILKESWASAPRLRQTIAEAVETFTSAYPDDAFAIIYTEDNTIEIRDGMGVLAQSLLLSVILVMVLLFIFLGNRSALWNGGLIIAGGGALALMLSSDSQLLTALCIGGLGVFILATCRAAILAVSGVAFSFLGALLVFWLMGYSLNEITLLGFILISGIIVDDAIIVIENIQRQREAGKPLLQAAVDGTSEVFWPVISAGLSTMFAFLPMLLMTGSVGEFFALVPIAVTTALVISLVEALFILPLHVVEAERLLGPDRTLHSPTAEPSGRLPYHGFLAWLGRHYDRILRWNLRHRWTCIAGAGILFLGAIGVLVYSLQAPRYGYKPIVRSEFFPEDLSVLMLTLRGPEGTSLEGTDDRARAVAAALDELGRARIWTITTFAGMHLDTTYKPQFANNLAVMMIKLPPRDQRAFSNPRAWVEELRHYIAEHPSSADWGFELRPAPTGPPTGLPVNVRISGADELAVEALADALWAWMQEQQAPGGLLPGLRNLHDDRSQRRELLTYTLDRRQLAAHNLPEPRIQRFLAAASEGLYVGEFRRSDGDIPIRVRLHQSVARNLDQLLRLPIIDDAQGRVIRFADVGSFAVSNVRASRERRDFQRTVTITGDLSDASPLSAPAVTSIIRDWYRPRAADFPGASIAFGGEAESTAKSYQSLFYAFILAIILIYAVLAAQFRSYFQPLIILSNIAFSFTGVILLMGVLGILSQLLPGIIHAERALFTVNSFIAIIGLSGLVVNDSIVLIDFINRLRREGHDLTDAILTAAHQRMRPMVLTTLTTIAGLLPMAIGLPDFSVTWGPFATSFIAGLAVATAMTLLVVPVLYMLLISWQERAHTYLGQHFSHLHQPLDE